MTLKELVASSLNFPVQYVSLQYTSMPVPAMSLAIC